MPLREELERTGNRLFRLRSYLPLVLAALFIPAFPYCHYPWHSYPLERLWQGFCLAVSLLGLGVRVLTIGFVPFGTSGRNTQEQKAEFLNTGGMYALVRHPLYLGNFLMWFGISLVLRLWWFTLLVSLIFWLYYERIIFAEEEFLRGKYGPEYLSWANATPAFFPKRLKWRPPSLPFSFKTVIRKEYHSFFAIIATFTGINLLTHIIVLGKINLDPMWTIIFLIGFLIYLTIRVIAKKTDMLKVEGR